MLQDGVGVDPHTLTSENDEVSAYFKAAQDAAEAASKPLWGNVELFTNLGDRAVPQLIPSGFDKVRLQLETVAPYIDKIVSFEFHFMDPHDSYTFDPVLEDDAAVDSTMRQVLYDSYKAYWLEWQAAHTLNISILPAVNMLLLGH